MKKLFLLVLFLLPSVDWAKAEVLEFSFLESVDCSGPIAAQQDFALPPSISIYAGELSVQTLGYMSVTNDTASTIHTNFSSYLSVRAKLLTRWAFDDLVVISDFQHFTDSLSAGAEQLEDISRDITKRGQAVHLSQADQNDLGVLGRIKIDGECLDWFASQDGVQDSAHQIVRVKVRLFYRP